MADCPLDGLARPPGLFLEERKNLVDLPMRQLVGVVERRSRRLRAQTTKQQGEEEESRVEQAMAREEGLR